MSTPVAPDLEGCQAHDAERGFRWLGLRRVGFRRSVFAASLSWLDRATTCPFPPSCLSAGFSRAWDYLIRQFANARRDKSG
ncbi:MAG: hypothetical protein B6D36_16330 [Planctomycetes bacterium UTPLA1]|nr:MAG: hypothetical protein B6D36_16330 [Planctomycetes bacterium UTPLA1]